MTGFVKKAASALSILMLLSLFTACFPGVILYIICLFVMPNDPGYTDVTPHE